LLVRGVSFNPVSHGAAMVVGTRPHVVWLLLLTAAYALAGFALSVITDQRERAIEALNMQ
jgi:hypothetical protein